jgi:omega-6 fatty acid desaturase (delta-12 desaturase)
MRVGPELVRASNEFAKEDRVRTWRLLLITLALWFTAVGVASVAPLWAAIPATVLAGLLVVRVFIFYHDYLHTAILVGSPVGAAIMRTFGYYVLAGVSVWRETHDYHHRHTAKIVGASIGSYPTVTVAMWQAMTPGQKFTYKLIRNPLTMSCGYFFMFIIGMCISPFRRQPKHHLDGLLALLFHFSLIGGVWALFGWQPAVLGVWLPCFIAHAAGSYHFYAQPNFPGMELKGRRDWEYTFAALHSSSMFDMNPIMHWFTGNIGYHHVHHLNHRIPFYRLPEAMAAMPELQHPHRTTWSPKDIAACLHGHVWDPKEGRMLTYAEAAARPPLVDEPVAAK